MGNGGAALSVFCYDIEGVSGTVEISQVGSETSGTALSVPSFSAQLGSFLVAIYTDIGSAPVYSPGNSNNNNLDNKWILTTNSPIVSSNSNYVIAETKTNSSLSATCPIRTSISQLWGGLCFAFAPSSSTNNANPPALAGAPYVIVGTGVSPGTTFGVNVTNPASNAFAITSITIIAPGASSGFSFTDSGATCGTANILLGTIGAASQNAIQCTAGTGTGLPPGFSQVITLGGLIGPVVAASAAPSIGTFTSLVVDSSGTGESYSGSSFNVYSIAPDISIAVTLSNSPATTFTAGSSAITVTATLGSGQVGVPLVFSFSAGSSYPASGFTSTIAPSSTLSSGSTTTTSWTPSNHAGDATGIKVTLGNSAITATSSTSLTTIAGAPSEVSFYFTNTGTTYTSDYLTNPVTVAGTVYATPGTTTISLSLADAYANAVTFSSSITAMTVSASGGEFLLATPQTLEASFSCLTGAGNIVCPTSGTSLIFGTNVNSRSDGAITYVQSSLYGATGTLSASITTALATYTGTSGNIITSALDSTLHSPYLINSSQTAAQISGNVFVQVGTSLSVYEKITDPIQQGVPITLNFCAACSGSSAGYDSAIPGFISSETLYTNSSGMVQETLPINSTAGSTAVFNATMAGPTTVSTTNTVSSGVSLIAQTTGLSQYTVDILSSNGGSTSPTGSNTYKAESTISLTAKPAPGNVFVNWVASSSSISIASPTKPITKATINGSGSITANFAAGVTISFTPKSISVVHGNTISTTAKISGASQLVVLSVTGIPKAASYFWASSSLFDSVSGVTDKLTINTAKTTPAGTYSITVVATGADGRTSTVKISLQVKA